MAVACQLLADCSADTAHAAGDVGDAEGHTRFLEEIESRRADTGWKAKFRRPVGKVQITGYRAAAALRLTLPISGRNAGGRRNLLWQARRADR